MQTILLGRKTGGPRRTPAEIFVGKPGLLLSHFESFSIPPFWKQNARLLAARRTVPNQFHSRPPADHVNFEVRTTAYPIPGRSRCGPSEQNRSAGALPQNRTRHSRSLSCGGVRLRFFRRNELA